MTALEILTAADELLADESKWCRGKLARGKSGKGVNWHGRAARQWCAEGAVRKVGGYTDSNALGLLDMAAIDMGKWTSYIAVNDRHKDGFKAVKRMFKLAIVYAKAEGN